MIVSKVVQNNLHFITEKLITTAIITVVVTIIDLLIDKRLTSVLYRKIDDTIMREVHWVIILASSEDID